MSADTTDDLILRHLDGDSTTQEQHEVTRRLANDPEFRGRFSIFVSLVAMLREVLDDRFRDGMTQTESGGTMQPAAAASRPAARAAGPEPAPASFLASLNLDLHARLLQRHRRRLRRTGRLAARAAGRPGARLQQLPVYLRMAIIGLLAGVCIGFAVGSTEGLIASRSLQRHAARRPLSARCSGRVGGLVGLVLGEFIFNLAGGGIWPRAFGWGIFGMLVGTSDGVAHKMPAKIRYGILGGLLGGLIGGSTYQGLIDTVQRHSASSRRRAGLGQRHRPGHRRRLHRLPDQPGRSPAAQVVAVLPDRPAGRPDPHARFSSRPHTLGSYAELLHRHSQRSQRRAGPCRESPTWTASSSGAAARRASDRPRQRWP